MSLPALVCNEQRQTKKKRNLEASGRKGIPESHLGPSGLPKTHNVSKPNNKRARDPARNNPKANIEPVKPSSKGQ